MVHHIMIIHVHIIILTHAEHRSFYIYPVFKFILFTHLQFAQFYFKNYEPHLLNSFSLFADNVIL